MKLLLFSDVHCSQPAVKRLIDKAEQADVLVGAGDFGIMRQGVVETLAPFETVQKPLVMVCGNGESDVELKDAATWKQAYVLHGNGVVLQGIEFFGLGGGIPVTPFGSWSFDIDEENATELLSECPQGGVLVVHSPPFGAVDVSSRGKHLGSQAIRITVERCRPRLVVCGHIHDSSGRWEKIGDTIVVNAGPEGILWDLESNSSMVPSDG